MGSLATQLAVLGPLLGTGVVVAVVHAAIPSHWLPFVLAARGQGWGTSRTLATVVLAGAGHVLLTTLLGAMLVYAGIELGRAVGEAFAWIAGGVLIAVGILYLWRQWQGGGHGHLHLFRPAAHDPVACSAAGAPHQGHAPHSHDGHGHHHHGEESRGDHRGRDRQVSRPVADASPRARRSDAAVIIGLVALLTFSPCEGFLPTYIAGAPLGWPVFLLLSGVLAISTVPAMVLFTWLTLQGLARVDLARLGRWEAGIQAVLFIGLGVLIIISETQS